MPGLCSSCRGLARGLGKPSKAGGPPADPCILDCSSHRARSSCLLRNPCLQPLFPLLITALISYKTYNQLPLVNFHLERTIIVTSLGALVVTKQPGTSYAASQAEQGSQGGQAAHVQPSSSAAKQ